MAAGRGRAMAIVVAAAVFLLGAGPPSCVACAVMVIVMDAWSVVSVTASCWQSADRQPATGQQEAIDLALIESGVPRSRSVHIHRTESLDGFGACG